MIQGVKGTRGKASGLLAMCSGRCKDFAMQLPTQVDACADAVPRQDSWKPSFGSACGEPFTLTDASLAAGVGGCTNRLPVSSLAGTGCMAASAFVTSGRGRRLHRDAFAERRPQAFGSLPRVASTGLRDELPQLRKPRLLCLVRLRLVSVDPGVRDAPRSFLRCACCHEDSEP